MNIEIGAPRNEEYKALCALWNEAFGDGEEFFDLFGREAYSPHRARVLRCDGELCAALYWFGCECEGEPIAYLYAIATAKAKRGRGLCRRLIENTHEHLRSLGFAAAMLVPSEASLFGFYEKLGYRRATRIGEFSCLAAEDGVPLLRIGKEEYEKIRRELLPPGGVIQEKENLTYLAAQTELYQGDGVLLAARREGEMLVGVELLGDRACASRLVKALGATKGSFRTVGENRDFSMIFSLNGEKTPSPTYFGLAFD